MLKKIVKKLIRKFNYDIVRYNNNFFGLRQFKFDVIIDIGAHVGEFSTEMLSLFPNSKIYAFEPNPEVYVKLELLKEAYGQRITTENIGIGDISGNLDLIATKHHTPSSSFLKLRPEGITQISEFTGVDISPLQITNVIVSTIDDYFKDIDLRGKIIFLKIDAQGYEIKILEGAKEFIRIVSFVMLEINLAKTYEGEATAAELISTMDRLNFSIFGFAYPPGIEEKSGRIIGFDLIFKRNDISVVDSFE
jgi:FkbM family methyltransferase